MNNLTRTKIIATVGPGTATEEKITALIEAGANVIRINSSHENEQAHKERIEIVRKVSEKLCKYTAIMLDLQGPKIRVGTLETPIFLEKGTQVKIKPSDTTDGSFIPVDYKGILNDVKKGERLLLDDGKLELKVVSVNTSEIVAKVIHGGFLKSRKGLNIPGCTTSVSAITERDIEYIKFAADNDVDYIALSFVRNREDILIAKHHIENTGKNIPLIAKIEKPQALDNIEEIIDISDAIMVARGDLGIEISPERVPIVQKQIIASANKKSKPVIVATQMLESMIEQPIPTRAETSDVANAVMDGADAVMLSGETAVGEFFVEAVAMMKAIAQNVEESKLMTLNKRITAPQCLSQEKDAYAIVRAIVDMVEEVEVGAIVAFTKTGYTARLLSKAKPSVPVIAISNHVHTCRRLSLYWGINAVYMNIEKGLNEKLMKRLDAMFIEESLVSFKDKVIITGSMPYLATGSTTNFIRLHEVGSYAETEV
ncbi:MAG: pyruvate kinase [bacterium]